MCPIFSRCGDTAVRMLLIKSLTEGMKERQMTYWLHLFGYVNDLNKLQQFKANVQKSHHRLQRTFQPSWQQ